MFRKKNPTHFVFSPVPAAGCGGDTAEVGVGLCVGEIGLLFDNFWCASRG